MPRLLQQNNKFKKDFKSESITLCLPQDNSQFLALSEHISINVCMGNFLNNIFCFNFDKLL